MPEFSYRAVAADGSMTQGRVSARNLAAAMRQLRGQGLKPLKLDPAGPGGAATASAVKDAPPRPARRRASAPASREQGGAAAKKAAARAGRAARGAVTRADTQAISAELAVLLRAGLPIDSALKVQIDMCSKASLESLLQELLETVKGGKPLSEGLAAYPEYFGTFYVNMVRSGEASGRLGEVLQRLAEYLERQREVRSSVVSALTYPAILACVALISVAVMLGFVVPQFEALFADMGEGLPGMTRLVIALGDVVRGWGWLLLLLGGLLVVVLRRWLRGGEGQRWRDRRLLALPVLGGLVEKYELARFARTAGTLLDNGVPLLTAVNIASNTVGNTVVRGTLDGLPGSIKAGRRVSDTLAESDGFSPLMVQMVRVGEESGRLDEMLLELAKVYDRDVEAGMKRALTLLEPLLILVMGVLIAFIIVSILMGILSVNDLAV